MEGNIIKQCDNKKCGPVAPKDPVERRSGFFIMYETAIEAAPRSDGKPSDEVYLDGGQLKNKARLAGGIKDEELLKLLENCDGFHKLVHSIGVSVKAKENYKGIVDFTLQNYGRKSKYDTGTKLTVPCPIDGKEIILNLEDYNWSSDDDVPGKIAFEFDNAGEMATASVRLYVNDGYQIEETSPEPEVPFDSEEYQAMISKSLLSKGNNKRLKEAIRKAERGDNVTIAYIGGSITQGAEARPIHENCYAYQSYLRFKQMFGKDGGDNIHFVKAGVGGTPSELGIIRYERDILRDESVEPDIVIVEFAVNDEGDETKGVCYESLALKILSAENKPAVILLFSVFVDDWNLQDRLSPVGRHYDLPMVSLKDALVDQFKLTKAEGNIVSKRQYFYDIYHPTNDGHLVMADCLSYLFSETKKTAIDEEDIILDKSPIIGNCFENIRLCDRKDNRSISMIIEGSFTETDRDLHMIPMDDDVFTTPQFPYNWMHSASPGNDEFKMTINCSSLILVFKDSGNSEFGKADIFVDGVYFKTADPHEVNWTHCNAMIILQEKDCSEHQVEIRMAEDSLEKCFTILGFGYTV